MQQKLIKTADYLNCKLEKLCKKSLCLALALKFLDPISISNICQKFYTLSSNTEKNQNLEIIYCRSHNFKPKIQNPD